MTGIEAAKELIRSYMNCPIKTDKETEAIAYAIMAIAHSEDKMMMNMSTVIMKDEPKYEKANTTCAPVRQWMYEG